MVDIRMTTPEGDLVHTPVQLLAVVVLYKQLPAQSPTVQTLLLAAKDVPASTLRLKTVLWDNTPGGQTIGELPAGTSYVSSPTNPGLAVAYNAMVAVAEAEGYDWLLTLDQDSHLPPEYLLRMAQLARELSSDQIVGAIVPQVLSGSRNISPFYLAFAAVPRWLPLGTVGIMKRTVYPINSGAVLRVTALRRIGGYDERFPLDVSDLVLFHKLQQCGNALYLAGDLLIRHNLAMLDRANQMSLERYDACLRDEAAFWDMYMGPAARLERLVRLTGRTILDTLRRNDRRLQRRTLGEIAWRLSTRRTTRLQQWASTKHTLGNPGGEVKR